MLKDFKAFLMQGNVVEIAVAFVIGAAFGKVVQGLLDGLINPLISAIFGKPDISGVLGFTINHSHFSIGIFLNAVLNFVIVAAAIFFVVILPMKRIQERRLRGQEPEPEAIAEEVVLLRQIRDSLVAGGGAPKI
jgi:large conductance mechanosensitive channel